MDIISHGLWGGLLFHDKSRKYFWLAFFIGMGPDLLSFGLHFLAMLFGITPMPVWQWGPPEAFSVPQYVHSLYNITHSLIIYLIIFLLVWAIMKWLIWLLLPWGLHIVIDIFTHSTDFSPTLFLWPVSSFRFNGISWAHPIIFIPNVLAVITLYIYFYVLKRRKAKESK